MNNNLDNFPSYEPTKQVFENIGNLKKMVFESDEDETKISIWYSCGDEFLTNFIELGSETNLEKSLGKILQTLVDDLNEYGNPQKRQTQAKFVAWCEVYLILRKYIFENFPSLINKSNQKFFELENSTIIHYYNRKKQF